MVAQLSAKQALWALSRAEGRVCALAAGRMTLMKELVAAMSLTNRWASFECALFAVRYVHRLLMPALLGIHCSMHRCRWGVPNSLWALWSILMQPLQHFNPAWVDRTCRSHSG